jgi:hypothetical protein
MASSTEDLGLEHLWVIYPGDREYSIGDRVSVLPLADFPGLARKKLGTDKTLKTPRRSAQS